MKNEDKFLEQLELRAKETSEVAGEWGLLRGPVQIFSGCLRVHPWRLLVPVSILAVGFLMFVVRGYSVKLVSWMQGLF